jgi:hypothetical protein
MDDAKARYDALYAEYQDTMHQGAWRLGWAFFFVMVGLLPMMYLFIWIVGPSNWEKTFFHAPVLMWIAAPLNLAIVVALLFRLYKQNLALDATKRRYLAELKALKAQIPNQAQTAAVSKPERDWDTFRDDALRD